MMSPSWFAVVLAGQLLGAPSNGVNLPLAQPSASVESAPPQGQPPVQFDASRFDSLTALSLRSLLEIAVENNLPTKPLINLALQGAARKASGPRILQIVREHSSAMMQAREALGPTSTVDELDAGASAIRAKVDERALSAVRETRAVGTAVVPLTVLTDIVIRGVPQTAARDAVTTIARMPSSDDALRGLQSTVAKNAVRGPGMAMDALNRYLRSTVSGAPPSAAPATTDRKPIRPPSP
jgi:hypothetical protein